ncbi:MAG: hypothetical protein INH41_08545 [Myxococcaceae bacterium]|jgi:hypothetical protein|nr:hypothetical protein [Myxococcaceae bacterium]MCA3012434.1 hypothetical protein [Myxococcaceae bacterium]
MRAICTVVVFCLAGSAHAAPKKGAAVRAAPVERPTVVVDAPLAMAKLLQAALSPRFAVSTSREPLDVAPTARDVRAAAATPKASAVVLARLAADTWSLLVFNGADGSLLETLRVRAPVRALPRNVAGALVLACATGQAPGRGPATTREADTTSEGLTSAKQPSRSASTSKPSGESSGETTLVGEATANAPAAAMPALRVGLGLRGFNRALSWSGDPDQALARYALGFAPAVALDVVWFPGAHVTTGVLANLGVTFQGDVGVGISSRQDAARFGTRAERFRVGALVRGAVGRHVVLEGHGGFSTQRFGIDAVSANDGTPRPNIPSVTLNGPRAAFGGRFGAFGPLTLDAQVGLTFLTFLGELGSDAWFRRATGVGLDVGGGVSLELVQHIHLRAGLDFTRYFLSLNPEDGGRFSAPAAADQYLGGSVGLLWIM